MKVVVCFSLVEDIDNLSKREWALIQEQSSDQSMIRKKVGLSEESALEQVLRIPQMLPNHEEIALEAVSFYYQESTEQVNLSTKLTALGYHVTNFYGAEFIRYQAQKKGDILRTYLDQSKQTDLFVFAHENEVLGFDELPYYLAEKLEVPLISNVAKIEEITTKKLLLSVNQPNGTALVEVDLPAIITIGLSTITHLRMPTLKDRIQTKNNPINKIQIQQNYPEIEQPNYSKSLPEQWKPIELKPRIGKITTLADEESIEEVYQLLMEGSKDK
ncbi:hypothetical protein ACWOFR_06040 [Carnobacterium gallinarum]|uniref:hypothetical protein n=1 Tax=Carnobacterium gallinarum TaxID=2749 RepID=UPI000555A1AA|nr:hypothetical protein [Carnobacterium gallinarum]